MTEQLEQFIVRELSKQRSRNELIRTVCEQSELNWPEAERLVQRVEEQHRRAIKRSQTPFMIFLSVGTFLMGIVLLIYSAEFFMAFFQGDTLEKILSVRSAYYRLASGITGLGMFIGGLIGIWQAVTPLFEE